MKFSLMKKKIFFEEDDFIIWHRFRATFIFRQNLKFSPGAWLNDLSIANCKGKLISPAGEKKIKKFQKKSI